MNPTKTKVKYLCPACGRFVAANRFGTGLKMHGFKLGMLPVPDRNTNLYGMVQAPCPNKSIPEIPEGSLAAFLARPAEGKEKGK